MILLISDFDVSCLLYFQRRNTSK